MNNKLLQEFQSWHVTKDKTKLDFVEHLKRHAPWILAHHPEHACFREHVWKINGLYICKGCLVTYLGFLVGAGFQLVTGWLSQQPEETLAVIFVVLLLPTVFSTSFDWRREIRHLSRFLLGFLLASSLLLLFTTERWEVRVAVIATFLVTRHIFEKKRRKKNDALMVKCGP